MSRPIRLLLVTKSTGGVASYIRTLVHGLDRQRYDITVACLSENGKEFAAELRQINGVHAFSLAMNRYNVNPLTDAWVAYELFRHFRKNRYDIIHAHASKPGFLTRLAALGTSMPVLYSPHNFAFHEGSNPWVAFIVAQLEGFAALFTARIITVAHHERELALKYQVGNSSLYQVVHTGINPGPFRMDVDVPTLKASLGIPLDAPIVGSVGRLAAPKLPLDFLHAAARVHKKMPTLHFVWAGSGPLEVEAKALTSSLGLDDVVHWLGERSDVPSLFSIYNFFVLPSSWEGFPIVILEAFASGVPVIATDNLGARELIETGQNGWLVPNGNIEALEQSILNVFTRPSLVATVSSAAKKLIDNEYALEKMISALECIYETEIRKLTNANLASKVSENHL
jgi:glycosyltransferase involved in cell wall biosynthesis